MGRPKIILSPTELEKKRADKAARARLYYETHKEQCNAAVLKWRNEHPNYFAERYQKNKTAMDAYSNKYRQEHRETIAERARQRIYKKSGRPIPARKFSFYNDVIKHLKINDPLWDKIMMLKLTTRQRQIAKLTRAGKTQAEIASILGCDQSNIPHTWNGKFDYNKNKFHGGIYAKVKKAGLI